LSRPDLNERFVNGKMFVTKECVRTSQIQHFGQEGLGEIPFQQPVPLLAEGRVIPHLVVRRQPHEPPEQKIIIQLRNEQPFAGIE
jgi:hypothetical protein